MKKKSNYSVDIDSARVEEIKQDRLRFTKNKLSSSMALLAIAFNALYFISLYSSDVGKYFYTYIIGASVVYNLLFMLCTFLSSEGVKSYKLSYAVLLLAVGAMQVVRIFYIPMNAHATEVLVGTENVLAMGDGQFVRVIAYLSLSALACFAGGVIGILKTRTLERYKKKINAI